MATCLTPEQVAIYVTSTATAVDLVELERHVDACEPCRTVIAAAVRAARGSEDPPDDEGELRIGARIGRYVVRTLRGTGAMSHVLEADDPDLSRAVALKIVRHHDDLDDARALREGRALARLSHPNVVAVYDVGVWTGGVFLAMELVPGETVRAWAAIQRGWREVVQVYAAAARGLDAAHRIGLVHRDIKPDNVMVGSDGRVRVIDFGLAVDRERPGDASGTPAYMAPEQRSSGIADARSDQYALMVSLFETLEGRRPGDTPAFRRHLPMWLRAAITRGLRSDPDQRHGSLAEVASRLDRGLDQRRTRLVAITAGLALASSATMVGWRIVRDRETAPPPPPPCASAGAPIDRAWNASRKQTIRRAFAATTRPFAETTAATTEATLDRYASRWAAAATDACEATRVRGTQSETLLDLRMACLDDRLRGLDALAGVLAGADAKVVENAVRAAQQLPDVDACADTTALAAPVPPPTDPAIARKVADVRSGLAAAKALRAAGKLDAAAAATEPLANAAIALDYAPLVAETLLLRGVLESDLSKKDTAEATLTRAVDRAEVGRADLVKAEAWIQLVRTATQFARLPQAHGHAQHAEASLARLGKGHDELVARLANYEGALAMEDADYPRALELQQKALAIRERIYGRDGADTATSLNSVGNVFYNLGRYPDARSAYERALGIRERVLGASHPDVAASHSNIGMVASSTNDFAGAIAHYQKAIAINDQVLGPDNPRAAVVIANLANVYRDARRFDDALAALARAIPIEEKALGPNHPTLANALFIKAECLAELGKYDEAVAVHERALAIRVAALGETNPYVLVSRTALGVIAMRKGDIKTAERIFTAVLAILEKTAPDGLDISQVLSYLADVRLERGDARAALALYERALAIDTKRLGPAHADLAIDLTGVGLAQLKLGDPRLAVQSLERALTLAAAPAADAVARGRTQLATARALWDAGADRKRARELAESARVTFAKAGDGAKKERGQAEAWLAAHAGS